MVFSTFKKLNFIAQAPWIYLTQPPCKINPCPLLQEFHRFKLHQEYDLDSKPLVLHNGMSRIVLATNKKSKKRVIIKQIVRSSNEFSTVYMMKDIRSEIATLQALNGHPNVTQLIDYYDEDNTVSLVIEYAQFGDLNSFAQRRGVLSEKIVKNIAAQLLLAIEACHAKNIVHRDVKLENVLITEIDGEKLTVQLADFGFSTNAKHPLTRRCGTPSYMAPEMWEAESYDVSVDIWSFGAMINYLLTGDLPEYGSIDNLSFDGISIEAKDFILKMLVKDRTKRASASSLREHPWLMDSWTLELFVHRLLALVQNQNYNQLPQTIQDRIPSKKKCLDLITNNLSEEEVDITQFHNWPSDIHLTKLEKNLPMLAAQFQSSAI
ncbi:myosin light chain kinase [Thraustotheca clavata]|uniref:Myosin light chain kinase n=1 Tax=Thraustotheca clavata TaxID=74557 RepID=A0A1V9YUN9_9STRA|nr:myosin light chain kinase [Thraustotheca clavata]